jgi:polyhydroxybutyrate depolymerase
MKKSSTLFSKLLRALGFVALGVLALVAAGAALFGYFLYTPEPALPALSGVLVPREIVVDGVKRTFLSYRPKSLPASAPLLLVMHGSGEDAQQLRRGTGYAFERLADAHGFALAYPESRTFDWNDCSSIGDYRVAGRASDDLGFLKALVKQMVADEGADQARVFAAGVSAGGSMALRLALEAPAQFRAVAAVSANVPHPDNFKCQPAGPGASVMLMNGTSDPLVPFGGGEVNLLGLFFKAGKVLSSAQSAAYFAALNDLPVSPARTQAPDAAGAPVRLSTWGGVNGAQVALAAIDGGGHGLPQPYARRPRLLGPSPMAPDGAALIWAFFARQPAR